MRRLMNMGIAASMAACGMCLYAKTSPANGAATKVEEKSDAAAQFRYAEMLRDGRGEAKNVRESVAWTRKAADGGLAAAQCQMGLFYVNGIGVDRDEDKAVEWLNKAAAQNHAQAQYNLGIHYAKFSDKESARLAYMLGMSVEQDKAKAVEWLRKAADQGEYRAMLWLGTAYEQGHGVAKDDWMAVDLWRRSHELGWNPATEKLHSLSYEYGKEAAKGNASAQFFMGVAQEYGYAGKPDAANAVEWYRKAAEQGHPGAMFNLGACYVVGTGVKKDLAEASKWFRKATSLGHKRSAEILEKLQKDVTR